MASIANTAFEVTVSNITRNNTQNVPGQFGTGTGSGFTSEICPAGFLCVQGALLPNAGYEGLGPDSSDILNGNTWEFIAATNGNSGSYGDHTGIYAFNSYDVRKVADNSGNTWMLGSNYLGLELPAGQTGDFTEIIIGEQYTFGAGNFSTAPSGNTYIYATIQNGRLVASTSAPAAGSGVYFKILGSKTFTVGTRSSGITGYICKACRTAEAAAE